MPEKKSNSTISKTEVNTKSTSGLNDELEYINIIKEAIKKLDKGSGCSRQKIVMYIKSKMKRVNEDPNFQADLDIELQYGVTMEIFYINEGAGGSGAYKLPQDDSPWRVIHSKSGKVGASKPSRKTPVKKAARNSKLIIHKKTVKKIGAPKASCKTPVRKATRISK